MSTSSFASVLKPEYIGKIAQAGKQMIASKSAAGKARSMAAHPAMPDNRRAEFQAQATKHSANAMSNEQTIQAMTAPAETLSGSFHDSQSQWN